MKEGTKIEVVWFDVEDEPQWTKVSSAKKRKPKPIKNIGYYLNEDKTFLRIYYSLDEEVKNCSFTIIPKGCVKSIRRLK